jgi:hemolysin-activating ACP:hemolysin acyltransferase
MAKSDEYCQYPIACITLWIEPAIRHEQIHFFFDDAGQACGYVTWAWLAADSERRLLHDPDVLLHISEWNEGSSLWILDFVVGVSGRSQFGRVCPCRYFAADEVGRLERGLTRLSQWSNALLVPFTAYRLRSAMVAWINRRWFLERGFDLENECTRRRVSAWLLDEFGWCVRSDPECGRSNRRTLWADRYGSTDGHAPHGGSGRVATLGCFQAKGIGRTPPKRRLPYFREPTAECWFGGPSPP